MKQYNIKSDEDLKTAIEGLFPGESYSRALELLQSIKRLAPENRDRISYLTTLIVYVDGILNGDDIHRNMTRDYDTKYAKAAFSEIMDETHEHILKAFRAEKLKLKDEIDDLTQNRAILDAQVTDLRENRNSLISQTTRLSTELEKMRQKLVEAKNNGMARVNQEIDDERRRVTSEVNSLNTQRDTLSSSVDELKKIINGFNRQIMSLGTETVGRPEVAWEPISDDSPIYGLNDNTIDDYIDSLIGEYSKVMGVSLEEASKIFKVNFAGLYTIKELLHSAGKWGEDIEKPPISYIIAHKGIYSFMLEKSRAIVTALKNIKEPKYIKKISASIDVDSLRSDTVPTDIGAVLRELYFQKKIAEARANQKIAEKQVEFLIQVLQRVLPEDYDISTLIPGYGEKLSAIPSDSNMKLEGGQPTHL